MLYDALVVTMDMLGRLINCRIIIIIIIIIIISAMTWCCILCVQKQDVTILAYHLVHWEDADSLAASTLNIISGHKEGPLLCKVNNNYSYMFGVGPTWTPAYFVLKYVYVDSHHL